MLAHCYAPMATIKTRYGYSQTVNDPNDKWIVDRLISELRSEQFEEPDDEHTEVAVGNEHWAVTAQVSGLVILDNMDLLEGENSDLAEAMYLRDIPDEQLICVWQAVVRSDKEALLGCSWKSWSELPSYVRDFYRVGA